MLLQEDARIPFAQIAKQAQLGETAVRYRVRRLRRTGVITRFAALLNPRMIGYPIDAIILVRANPARLDEVFRRMAQHEETSHLLQTTGEHDLVSVVHARDSDHLNQIVREIKRMPGVRSTLTWIATGLVKIDPIFKLY